MSPIKLSQVDLNLVVILFIK